MTELIFIRHGDREHASPRQLDVGLTPLGFAQAERVAERLVGEPGLAALYTSPLRRARLTAEVIANHTRLDPIVEPALREGSWIDLFASLWATVLYRLFRVHSPQRDWFFGVGEALERIVTAHPYERVVIVTHQGTIRAALAHYLTSHHPCSDGVHGWVMARHLPEMRWRWWTYPIGNATVTRLTVTDGQGRLLTLSDRSHLGS
jgi:broad specificity phosphatase PhoE